MSRLSSKRFLLFLAALSWAQLRCDAPALAQSECVDSAAAGGVIGAYFRIISGPPGDRDWAGFNSLLLETARFDAVGINEKGENQFFPQSRDQYIRHVSEYVKGQGFFQKEVRRVTTCYARIAHVLSTYESRNEAGGKTIDRGLLSFQMIHEGGRWKIAHVVWNSETKRYPLPAEFLR
ncbi:MAG TPA: hypothetical protein VE262_21520 [Blastocatellia bacterium]|nr:hypothetical protein [Blastocatellia bacterium]